MLTLTLTHVELSPADKRADSDGTRSGHDCAPFDRLTRHQPRVSKACPLIIEQRIFCILSEIVVQCQSSILMPHAATMPG